jgi:hypothetical protein
MQPRNFYSIYIPYLREKGPMGNLDWGDGPIFEVSLSQLDVKERQGKLELSRAHTPHARCICIHVYLHKDESCTELTTLTSMLC